MTEKIAIVAALPREIAALVRGIKPDARMLERGVWLYRMECAVVVAAGMGAARAAVAVEAALAEGGVGMLISTGLAGGCEAGVVAGAVMEAGVVIDALTGERFVTAVATDVTLASAGTIASVSEKARLVNIYGAAIVDMEAASVARLARAHGLGFRAIKGVSDAHDFELSALAKFAGEQGSFRTGAFALYTALRPWEWGKAVKLGRGSAKALAGLEVALQDVIAEGRWV